MLDSRYELRVDKHDKKQLKKVKDAPAIIRWVIYRVELIRYLMKIERDYKADRTTLSQKDLVKIEYYLFKNGQY